jgi:hypothetical protein
MIFTIAMPIEEHGFWDMTRYQQQSAKHASI